MARVTPAVFFLLCISVPCAHAARISGLYEAEVSVPDRSAPSRQAALSAALGAVIVKITGVRHAPAQPAVAPILQLAEKYVQQDQYREAAQGAAGSSQARLRLWVRFDEGALNSDLRQLGLPVWDRERPSILTWLVVTGDTGRGFVTPDDRKEFMVPVEERARSRGLALVFPLFDLQDSAGLQTGDIGSGPSDAVLEASRRYQADSILAGNVEQTAPGVWEGRWTAYLGGQPLSWSSEGDSPDEIIEEGIDGMADRLAVRFAQQGATADAVQLDITVSDVNTVDDYARTLKYLSSLSSVAALQVTQVQTGEVEFALSVHGGGPALDQALSFGRMLEPVPGGAGGRYRLLP